MKFLHITVFVMCFVFIAHAIPIPDEENTTEKAPVEEPEHEEKEEPEHVEESIKITKKSQLKKEKKEKKVIANDSVAGETKSSTTVTRLETPSSNPSSMNIKSWGPNDYEYSFETSNQRQAKTIHIEDKPENEDNTYDISDKGSYSTHNDEHGYIYKVEYTAGSDGYRPKVSFSFHS